MIRPIIKTSGIQEAQKRLEKGGFSRAMASTLTLIAYKIARAQEETIKASFAHVSKYTLNSLFYFPPQKGMPLDRQNAVVGSMSSYLANLEDGFQPQNITYSTETLEGKSITLAGRFIASQASRNPDNTVKKSLMMSKLSNTFVINNSASEQYLYVRNNGKLMRLRAIKKNVQAVKAYKWHKKAVDKIYSPGLVSKTFGEMLIKQEGFERI